MRTMFVWRSASTLPTVIVSTASTQTSGPYTPSAVGEGDEDHEDQRHETGRLRRHRQERGDRRRRALVGVGRPRVERHGRDLEGEPAHHEHDGDDLRGRSGCLDAIEAPMSTSFVEPVVPYSRLMPYSSTARGEHAEQVVLDARLVALAVALAPGGEHVGGDRQQLERDEDAHAGRGSTSSSPCRARCTAAARRTRPGSSRPPRARSGSSAPPRRRRAGTTP